MLRRTGRRNFGSKKPQNVQWAAVAGQFLINGVTVTSASVLVQLQAPASLAALTADPPEDLTILRMRGSFSFLVTGSATARWTLALTVQDTVWAPGTDFNTDSDKRILWSRKFNATNATSDLWMPPGTFNAAAAGPQASDPRVTEVDIAPKVRIQTGQALHLVAYEDNSGGTVTVSSDEMRILYKRSGRR